MRFIIPILVLAFILSACEDIADDDDDDNDGDYYEDEVDYDPSQTYTITVISERHDVVEVKLDGDYKGTLVMHGSRLGFTAKGGKHKIEFWGTVGGIFNPEDVLIAEETFVLNEDMTITIKPL